MRNQMKSNYDIYDRSLKFATKVAKLVDRLPKTLAIVEYSRQLIRSSGSVGANLEVADGTLTKKDFVSKIGISRREAKESRHWLRLIKDLDVVRSPVDIQDLERLLSEAYELASILSSIIKKTKSRFNI